MLLIPDHLSVEKIGSALSKALERPSDPSISPEELQPLREALVAGDFLNYVAESMRGREVSAYQADSLDDPSPVKGPDKEKEKVGARKAFSLGGWALFLRSVLVDELGLDLEAIAHESRAAADVNRAQEGSSGAGQDDGEDNGEDDTDSSEILILDLLETFVEAISSVEAYDSGAKKSKKGSTLGTVLFDQPEQLSPGSEVLAILTEDGQYHPAVVVREVRPDEGWEEGAPVGETPAPESEEGRTVTAETPESTEAEAAPAVVEETETGGGQAQKTRKKIGFREEEGGCPTRLCCGKQAVLGGVPRVGGEAADRQAGDSDSDRER